MISYLYSLHWFYKRRIKSPTNNRDLVLEIGSGDKPHWRSDVLVDRYLCDNSQRILGDVLIDNNKLFIIADIGHLPFKNKTFDYIMSSHVLEHIENLDMAIKEISRVGKAGYIELPYGFLDIIKPFDTHLWICDIENDCLIFRRKTKNLDPLLLKFGNVFSSKDFSDGKLRNLDKIFIMHKWKYEIKSKIYNVDGKDKYTYKNDSKKPKEERPKLNTIVYKLFYKFMCVLLYRNKT